MEKCIRLYIFNSRIDKVSRIKQDYFTYSVIFFSDGVLLFTKFNLVCIANRQLYFRFLSYYWFLLYVSSRDLANQCEEMRWWKGYKRHHFDFLHFHCQLIKYYDKIPETLIHFNQSNWFSEQKFLSDSTVILARSVMFFHECSSTQIVFTEWITKKSP